MTDAQLERLMRKLDELKSEIRDVDSADVSSEITSLDRAMQRDLAEIKTLLKSLLAKK
jgi:hypothetical protein